MNVVKRGADYSAGYPTADSLVAAGIQAVARYAVLDWRGIKPDEIVGLRAKGIDIALVHEADENRLIDGYAAGVYDATSAHNVLLTRGLNPKMPLYFACDFDAAPSDQPAIDQYLKGAGDAIGKERVGIYGGYWVVKRCMENKTARFGWQTSAWSGGQLYPDAHLYQYAYNRWIGGVNCDLTDAYQDNFGQEAAADSKPQPSPGPLYPAPHLPDFYDRVNAQSHPSSFRFEGYRFYPVRSKVTAEDETRVYTWVDRKTVAGEPVMPGRKIAVDWILEGPDKHVWLCNGSGYYYGAKYEPRLQIPTRGKPVIART